jgi:hypothetical protein
VREEVIEGLRGLQRGMKMKTKQGYFCFFILAGLVFFFFLSPGLRAESREGEEGASVTKSKAFKERVKEEGRTIKEGAKEAGREMKQSIKELPKRIKQDAKRAGKATKETGRKVKKHVRDSWETTKKKVKGT